MFNDSMGQLHPPEKFKKSDKMFWQEPHIAKYLLEAHLDSNYEIIEFEKIAEIIGCSKVKLVSPI